MRTRHSRLLFALGTSSILMTTPAAAQDAAPVHVAVGVLGAAGYPGSIAAVRLSGIGSRVGFDFDWGVITDAYEPTGRFMAGQLRLLPWRQPPWPIPSTRHWQ